VTSRNLVLLFSAGFLVAVIQLLAALASPWAAIAGGFVVALLLPLLLRFFGVEIDNLWAGPLTALLASAAGVLAAAIANSGPDSVYLAFAPPAAMLTAAAWALIKGGGARCSLCERGLRGVAFECPRCGLAVGEQCCWVHDRLRCRLCEQNQVPIFTADKRWWDQNFGPRVRQGQCQVTLETAENVDLRGCPRCARLQSTEAWDLSNGECARCNWVVEDVPERLRPYVA